MSFRFPLILPISFFLLWRSGSKKGCCWLVSAAQRRETHLIFCATSSPCQSGHRCPWLCCSLLVTMTDSQWCETMQVTSLGVNPGICKSPCFLSWTWTTVSFWPASLDNFHHNLEVEILGRRFYIIDDTDEQTYLTFHIFIFNFVECNQASYFI